MTNDWWVQPSIKPHLLSLCQYQTIIKETCCESSLWQQCNCVDYIFILLLAANFFSSGIMLWWWLWLLADDFFARGTITEAAGLFQGIELLTWWRPLPTAEFWSVCRLTQVVHFCRYKYYVDRFVLWESLGWVKEGIYSVCHLSPESSRIWNFLTLRITHGMRWDTLEFLESTREVRRQRFPQLLLLPKKYKWATTPTGSNRLSSHSDEWKWVQDTYNFVSIGQIVVDTRWRWLLAGLRRRRRPRAEAKRKCGGTKK